VSPQLESFGNDAWVKEDHGPRRRFIAYYRVSTRAQGRSGLGLEAQQATVSRFLLSTSSELFAEFTEVESGKKAARPQFNEALRLCRIFSAVLVIAKLDRLARNVALISQLMESGVEFVAADFPQANRLTIHILAAIAEYEAKLISERVKAAIVASKARGVVWGGNRNSPTAHLDEARRVGNEGRRRRATARALDLEPLIMEMREGGKSLKGIAAELNSLRIRQRRGGINWTPSAVRWALRWSADLFPNRKKWNKFAQRFE
jgi:DNA invertase Pin-like site-specific DNA recombinase